MSFNLYGSHAEFLTTSNPLLAGYWRLGDSPPPAPTVLPWGSNGSGMMTDNSSYKRHLTHGGMVAGTDITIVSGLVPYATGGGSGLRFNLTGSVTKRLYLDIQECPLSMGALTATRFNRPSGWTMTGWVSHVASTGSANSHIINMSINPDAMTNGESFAMVLDFVTAPLGHLKFAAQLDDTTTFVLRANRFPLPAIGSGIFWAVVYDNNSTLSTSAGSGIFKLYIGDCRSSGVREVATQVISNRANVMMETVENTTEPLAFGTRSTLGVATAAYLPANSIIDDISVWHTKLNVAQLEYIKNSGIVIDADSAQTDVTMPIINPGNVGLIACWSFDNNSTSELLGLNDAPNTIGRFNFGVNPANVTPVPGIRGGSGIRINVITAAPGDQLTLSYVSGINDLFPDDTNGSFTWIGWVKQSGIFNNWSFGWNRTTLVNGTTPDAKMGHGRLSADTGTGGGLIQFDASGQAQDITTENMTQASNLRPPLGAWTLYALVWDNINRLYYVVKDARQIIGFQHGPPSGISRARWDVSSPETDANFTFAPRNTGAKPFFDDWAIYNKVLTFPEMSGYALNGMIDNAIFTSSQSQQSIGILDIISQHLGKMISFN